MLAMKFTEYYGNAHNSPRSQRRMGMPTKVWQPLLLLFTLCGCFSTIGSTATHCLQLCSGNLTSYIKEVDITGRENARNVTLVVQEVIFSYQADQRGSYRLQLSRSRSHDHEVADLPDYEQTIRLNPSEDLCTPPLHNCPPIVSIGRYIGFSTISHHSSEFRIIYRIIDSDDLRIVKVVEVDNSTSVVDTWMRYYDCYCAADPDTPLVTIISASCSFVCVLVVAGIITILAIRYRKPLKAFTAGSLARNVTFDHEVQQFESAVYGNSRGTTNPLANRNSVVSTSNSGSLRSMCSAKSEKGVGGQRLLISPKNPCTFHMQADVHSNLSNIDEQQSNGSPLPSSRSSRSSTSTIGRVTTSADMNMPSYAQYQIQTVFENTHQVETYPRPQPDGI